MICYFWFLTSYRMLRAAVPQLFCIFRSVFIIYKILQTKLFIFFIYSLLQALHIFPSALEACEFLVRENLEAWSSAPSASFKGENRK